MTFPNCSKIIITGGSGFIGTNACNHLSSAGHDVLNLDISQPRDPKSKSEFSLVDICNYEHFYKIVHDFQPEYIIHLAARTDLNGKSLSDYSANIEGVENLVNISNNISSLRRVVFASSRLVCKIGYQPKSSNDFCPTTYYGESKMIGEMIVRNQAESSYCWSLVRPTSIWGPWFDVPYRNFFDAVISNRYIHPKDHMIYKSFGYVGNTVCQLESLLFTDSFMMDRKLFYLSDYDPIEVLDFANQIRLMLSKPRIRQVPIYALRFIAYIGDFLKLLNYKSPPLTTFRLNNILTPMIYNNDSLKEISGNLPYTCQEGIIITLNWIESNP